MGLMDNITSAVNRGTAAAGRETEKIRLKARMNELTKQRQGLAAQLGASLYEATRGGGRRPALRARGALRRHRRLRRREGGVSAANRCT